MTFQANQLTALGDINRRRLAVLAALLALVPALRAADAGGVEFFEKKIRPLLAERCYECHSTEKKKKGGLLLDSKAGWATGGDSGPALVPNDLEKSLLIKAVRYTDRDLKMPPKHKLSDAEVADLEKWVSLGAPDPRTGIAGRNEGKPTYTSIEAGKNFWSFIPPKKPAVPDVQDKSWARGDIDRFILARLEAKNLKPAADTDRATLLRRVYFDLIGLPPTPEEIEVFVKDTWPDALEQAVDRLLASQHFGERWGRHWLDLARFAESSGGGRTLLFKDAWRYRDYVIEAFNADRPYNQFLTEQIAGDLLDSPSAEERRRHITATAFLALGPTNYEEQDKGALRMDVVDEQLDTLGRGVLGMTIGCARCHDHKFDPIPTRDYYAMAGIFRSTRTLFNFTDNVARWVDTPLPMDGEKEAAAKAHQEQIAALEANVKKLKTQLSRADAALAQETTKKGMPVAPGDLPGIVVDEKAAKAVGAWTHSLFSRSYVGEGYLHDGNSGKGEKTLTFVPEIKKTGRFEVRLAYIHSNNRAENTPVTIFHADGENTVRVNQREAPPIEGRFVSLGQYRFETSGAGYVLVSNEGTTGHVIADAVQFIPVEDLDSSKAANKSTDPAVVKRVAELKKLEAELKALNDKAPPRNLAMSVREDDNIEDTHVHIRGNIRNLGEKVPRGFLTVALNRAAPVIPGKESGRRQFAEWVADPENPLTARVLVNRVWSHVFGQGIVRSVDNFGTTGDLPTHPELLDHLALRFIGDGWSMKKFVRQLVLSRTYQMSSTPSAAALAADPDNHLLTRMNRRRLDAEALRDTLLTVSGRLDLTVGGPNIMGAKAINANDSSAANVEYSYKFPDARRSVYTPAFRNNRLELFEAFDFSDINATIGRRETSTVATQALYLMNHPFVIEQARLAAKQALQQPLASDAARLERAFRSVLGRTPSERERKLALDYLATPASEGGADDARQKAWAYFYQTLFASIDFRYLH